MAFVNYNNKEITVKIVYYGPALSGKTTCLQYTYTSKEYKKKGKLITLDTDGDRTLFFDFLPIEIGKLGDYSIKMQLYTVPGQVAYDTTRKLVLQGSDGVVFVADSQVVMREQNISSLKNLKENLKANKISFGEIPLILQYNKRDLREILPVDVLNRDLNPDNKPFFPTVGTTGENILEALHTIMKMVIIYLKNKLTVFQKDKTVMFSREEATDTLMAPRGAGAGVGLKPPIKKEMELPIRAKENVEKDDLFELSTPIPLDEELHKTQNYKPPINRDTDEEIFNLQDDNILGGDHDFLEIPEANLKDELGESREDSKRRIFEAASETLAMPAAPSPVPRGMKDKEKPVYTQLQPPDISLDKIIEVPLNIQIPADKDEIRINFNIQLVVKKK